MAKAEHEFGLASQIKADALGTPGQRRFRVLIEGDGGKACAWLEKEELLQLATSAQDLLATYGAKSRPESQRPGHRSAQGDVDLDFQVRMLALGYDQQGDLFILEFSDEAFTKRKRTMLRVTVDRTRMREFAEQALSVCAAGRPLCPLCGGPIGPGAHICPRANGHILV